MDEIALEYHNAPEARSRQRQGLLPCPWGAAAAARAIALVDPLSCEAQVEADGVSLEVQGASELVARAQKTRDLQWVGRLRAAKLSKRLQRIHHRERHSRKLIPVQPTQASLPAPQLSHIHADIVTEPGIMVEVSPQSRS